MNNTMSTPVDCQNGLPPNLSGWQLPHYRVVHKCQAQEMQPAKRANATSQAEVTVVVVSLSIKVPNDLGYVYGHTQGLSDPL